MQLISNVRQGFRPEIPEFTPTPIAKIIQDCWQSNFALRPKACNVAKELEAYLGCDQECASQQNSLSPEMSSMYTQDEIFFHGFRSDRWQPCSK